MKKTLIVILLLTSLHVNAQDEAFRDATKKWFAAWKLVCKDIYGIDKMKPVEFVFYDDKYVYSTSSTTIKKGQPVKGNDLLNLKLTWKKALHHDSITLPDNTVVPIMLMSFAAEIPHQKGRSFFTMPLPGYWEKSGVSSKELGLENLITGVFIHEFSHSQQMQNFGKKITAFEKQHNYGIEFNDDIVQNIFEKDTTYLKLYNREVEVFYNAIDNQRLVREGLSAYKLRQETYFKNQYADLTAIDNLFLTMEGLGQYSMYLWLIHPQGGNIDRKTAIEGVRRKRKWWSQDEGFALFLILDKMVSPGTWAKDMFGDKTNNVTDLIAENASLQSRIETLNLQYAQALEKGDVSAMTRYYAEDAVSMPEHHPTLFNHAAITGYYQQWLAATKSNRYQRTIHTIKVADGYLLESGTYTHDFIQAGREPFHYAGKYVHIWRIGKEKALTLVSEIWGASSFFDNAALPPLKKEANTRTQVFPVKPADSALARTVKGYNTQIAQLVKDRNGAGFADYYTDDAIYMPYYMPMVIGKDSIHQYYVIHEDPNVGIDAVQINISRMLPAGDYVLVNGFYSVNWRAGGNSGLVTGKSINIWKKEQDGKLRLYWQMTNHD